MSYTIPQIQGVGTGLLQRSSVGQTQLTPGGYVIEGTKTTSRTHSSANQQTMTTATAKKSVGTIIFRPLEGRIHNNEQDVFKNIDTYCKFKIGWRSGKSSVAKEQGVQPNWTGDAISIKVKNHDLAKVKVKEKDKFRPDALIGSAKIPLALVFEQGKTTEWIPVSKKDIVTAEIKIEMEFIPKEHTF